MPVVRTVRQHFHLDFSGTDRRHEFATAGWSFFTLVKHVDRAFELRGLVGARVGNRRERLKQRSALLRHSQRCVPAPEDFGIFWIEVVSVVDHLFGRFVISGGPVDLSQSQIGTCIRFVGKDDGTKNFLCFREFSLTVKNFGHR